jgi:tRNA/tmRNA/rRNA uracil-C5-methylase (TrmA/RlmC/RlmD family)
MPKMKRKRTTGAIPQKGEPGYLTPTQLRNRRKRRAKKEGSSSSSTGARHVTAAGDAEPKATGNKASINKNIMSDPSMKYIHDPIKAPIVQAAKKFFKPMLQNCNQPEFRIHVGPLDGWRTVAKLAVRPTPSSSTANNSQTKVAIGLFLPQSHTLLPVPNCRAHHPAINCAVECIEQACHDVGVIPYQEQTVDYTINSSNINADNAIHTKGDTEKGSGQLRYVAINVARESGAVQITLVWNDAPPRHGGKSIEDPTLQKLVCKILDMSSASIKNSLSNINGTNDREIATSTVATTYTTACTEDPSPKKRRRRGNRHEGRPTNDGDSNISCPRDNRMSNSGTTNPSTTTETTSNTKLRREPDKLNLHSLWINYNQSWKHSNAIFSFDSTCWEHVYGPRAIIEHLNFDVNDNTNNPGQSLEQNGLAHPRPPQFSIPLHFPPNVFRQANLDSFTNIVGRIRERMQQFDKDDNTVACVELYGGVGTIGLHVSDMVTSLVSSDENPNNSRCYYDSVRLLPTDIQARLVYQQLNAADMITSNSDLFQRRCQVLIVDPPRKGLDIEVVNYLCKDGWKTMKLVVYVSCGFLAFQRDCDLLLKSGKWKMEFAEGYLLFPGSDAIETLAFFAPLV